MKKIIEQIRQSWFFRLSWWQKLIVLYFTLSFCLLCSYVEGPWWGALMLTGNFGLSGILMRYVPMDEND